MCGPRDVSNLCSVRLERFLCAVVCGLAACNGEDPPMSGAPDAGCIDEPIELTMQSPDTYMCQDGFEANLSVRNGLCRTLQIGTLSLTAAITQGANCSPAAASEYEPRVATIPAKTTRTILDLTNTNKFCCTPTVCPTPFVCEERFEFEVPTSSVTLTASVTATLRLSGCDEVCP